jgi:hypothetical protein
MRNRQLVFYGPAQGFRERLALAEFERSVQEGRGDRIYWNRNEPGAMRRPGEVVS